MQINDGDTVCIVGGGPGGSACAMTLLKEARRLDKKINVVIIEHKIFPVSVIITSVSVFSHLLLKIFLKKNWILFYLKA